MSKLEADGLRKINVVFLKDQGYFTPDSRRSGTISWTSNYRGNQGSARIEVSTNETIKYLRIVCMLRDDYTGEEKKYDHKVLLTTTPCFYGGKRYWLLCHCGARVGTLYFAGRVFACRHCNRLTYDSRNESRRYRRFVSAVDLERQEEKVMREYYRGRPTKKYARYLRMLDRFYQGITTYAY